MNREARVLHQQTYFTYLGRHMGAMGCIKNFIALNKQRARITCFGSGPIEPAVIFNMYPDNGKLFIKAIDNNPKMLELGRDFLSGKPIALNTLAETCINNLPSGPQRNADFENESFEMHFQRLERLLGHQPFVYDKENLTIALKKPIPAECVSFVDADLFAVQDLPLKKEKGTSHVIFAGGILVNLRRAWGDEKIAEWFRELSLVDYDLFVASFTPQDLTSEVSTLSLLMSSRFNPVVLFCDKLVIKDGKALGDFELVCVRSLQSPKFLEFFDSFRDLLSSMGLKRAKVYNTIVEEFRSVLMDVNRIPVAALSFSGSSNESLSEIFTCPSEMKNANNYEYWDDLANKIAKIFIQNK